MLDSSSPHAASIVKDSRVGDISDEPPVGAHIMRTSCRTADRTPRSSVLSRTPERWGSSGRTATGSQSPNDPSPEMGRRGSNSGLAYSGLRKALLYAEIALQSNVTDARRASQMDSRGRRLSDRAAGVAGGRHGEDEDDSGSIDLEIEHLVDFESSVRDELRAVEEQIRRTDSDDCWRLASNLEKEYDDGSYTTTSHESSSPSREPSSDQGCLSRPALQEACVTSQNQDLTIGDRERMVAEVVEEAADNVLSRLESRSSHAEGDSGEGYSGNGVPFLSKDSQFCMSVAMASDMLFATTAQLYGHNGGHVNMISSSLQQSLSGMSPSIMRSRQEQDVSRSGSLYRSPHQLLPVAGSTTCTSSGRFIMMNHSASDEDNDRDLEALPASSILESLGSWNSDDGEGDEKARNDISHNPVEEQKEDVMPFGNDMKESDNRLKKWVPKMIASWPARPFWPRSTDAATVPEMISNEKALNLNTAPISVLAQEMDDK